MRLIISLLSLSLVILIAAPLKAAGAEDRPPNLVIIFTDDLGYADVGVYGAEGFETPHLDRMAEQGTRFTDFYVPQAVCSASRAGLLTGCYPNRVSIFGALDNRSEHGLNPDELTLADLAKDHGYATAIFGKWHLGHHEQFLPHAQGFDEYYGIPYSNDMWPHHPTAPPDRYPELPVIEGTEVVNPRVTAEDQKRFTTEFTERAVDFIGRHRDEPFFVYLAHPMPHVPLFVSEKFADESERGLYGDVIMEIDWSVGQVLGALEEHGIEEDTLVVFLSDNGPWLSYGDHGGSAGELREGKVTTFGGGVRVPAIMRWPGTIPAGHVIGEPAMSLDILPTFAALLGADLPDDRIIDGKDIGPLIRGEEGARSPHEAIYFYWHGELQAIRSGRWKLHFPHTYPRHPLERATGGEPVPYRHGETGLELFDKVAEPSEMRDLADAHPEVVERLKALADEARADLGDALTETRGANVRPPGRLR